MDFETTGAEVQDVAAPANEITESAETQEVAEPATEPTEQTGKTKADAAFAAQRREIEEANQRAAEAERKLAEMEAANKALDKEMPSKLKYSYKDLTQQEYNKLATAAQTGQLDTLLKSDKDLAKKVADLNVKDYVKGAGAMGFMDQITQGLSVSQNPAYKYSDSQKQIMEKQKQTTAYNVGRMAGAVAEFGMGGTGAMGSAMFKTAGKAALKEAAKGGGKSLAKAVGKNVAKETAGDTIASLGLNTLDALKFSYKDGKFDKGEFVKELALNVGGDILIGGVTSGITHGLSAKQVSRFNAINKKAINGKELTEAEWKFYDKHVEELGDKVRAAIEGQGEQVTASKRTGTLTDAEYKQYIKLEARRRAGAMLSEADQKTLDNIVEKAKADYVKKAEDAAVAEVRSNVKPLNASYRTSGIDSDAVEVEYKKTFTDYINSTDSDLAQYIKNAINGNATSKNMSFGVVRDAETKEIQRLTNIDTTGYKRVIGSNDIEHIADRHGASGTADNSMADVNDMARIGYIMDNPDSIYRTVDQNGNPVLTNAYLSKEGKPSPQVTYEKRVDGHVYVVTTVIDSNKKWLRVSSAYMTDVKKTKNSQTGVAQSHSPYVRNASASVSEKVAPELVNMADAPHLTSKTFDPSATTNNISNSVENVNLKEAELQKANGEPFTDAAARAYANPGKQYDTMAESIKSDNPTVKEIRERAMKDVADDEIAMSAKKIDDIYFTDEELHKLYADNEAAGAFDKAKGMSQAEARQMAEREVEEKGAERMAEDFVNNELPADGHITGARVEVLLRELKKSYQNGIDNKALQMKVVEKAAVEFSSTSARNLNAVKMFLKATPYGRVRIAMKQAEALSNEFSSRLKGKTLKLSDDQIDRIYKAETDEEVAAVMEKINLEIWEQIPSSLMEKINMTRHIQMLFNVKTNARNLGGNLAFRGARSISDGIEYVMTRAAKGVLEKKGADTVMSTRVTHSEYSNAHKYIYDEVFQPNYKASNSTGRFIEKRRPDGSTVLTSVIGSNLEKATFKVLEAGDVYPAFRPAYTRSYLRWCKHNGVDINDVDALKWMSDKDKAMANEYAMKQAEKATFRDACAVSDKLIELKSKTESGQGKTSFGTLGLRIGNMALESVLPFVKTPINVFRRSIDYSPISLIRAAGDLTTYAIRKDTDALLNGIHHMATGLTGSGVALLGMWLAHQDLIMVKAGEVSGDAYYDRDMGYQDYSLMIGGKSITIDWASPMQTSLFMGAQARNIIDQKDELEGMDFFNAAMTMFEPHLEASFMSSAKDTLELFMETADGDGTESSKCWGEAILATLGGTIPQNYINTFISSQLTNQAAQAFDKYQRDTRSTSDDPLKKSWESWGRKVINRIPGLRNEVLNPKLNRKGENVESEGDNIVTRMLNAFLNPSNVKTIDLTKTDKEIIKIYKGLPTDTKDEREAKRYFYYNLTGQGFDKGDGTRMTYDEAYKHGKKLRGSQWKNIETMIKAERYKNMENSMKAAEMKSYNIISTTKADRQVYGDSFAIDRVINQFGSTADKRVAQSYKGKNENEFLNFYVRKETMLARGHDTDDYSKAAACYKYGNWEIAKQYDISKSQWENAKDYFENKGGTVTKYVTGECNAMSSIIKAGADVSIRNKAIASADYDTDADTLRAMGIRDVQINMGYGLNKEFGYSYDALKEHVVNAKISFDSDDCGSLSKREIVDYIDSLGLETNEEKACLFEYIYNRDPSYNPYGGVPNYLNLNNYSSSGGYGYGKSKSKKSPKKSETDTSNLPSWAEFTGSAANAASKSGTASEMPSWEDYVKDYMSSIGEMSGVKFKDWDSPLDQAYRSRINKILNNTKA